MTSRRTKRLVTTGKIEIDGYQAESWFISLTMPSQLVFKNLIGGRLYCLAILQSGNQTISWPAGCAAANVDPRSGSVSVQTFIANGSAPWNAQAIAAMTYLEK